MSKRGLVVVVCNNGMEVVDGFSFNCSIVGFYVR